MARQPLTAIMAKGACPICVALVDFQITAAENLVIEANTRFCNLHMWAIANKAPTEVAAFVFLAALRDAVWKPAVVGSDDCHLCTKLKQTTQTYVDEFRNALENPKTEDWLRGQGTLCVRHARELCVRDQYRLEELVTEMITRNADELEKELLESTNKTTHVARGVLARIAEFLVSRRGIID